MMDRIIKFALNHRLLILFGGIIFTMAGLLVVLDMDVDIFPDLNAPTVVIMTEAHGMASEEVEKLITFPIETAVNGSPNIRRVRSASSMGFSIVWAEFDWDIDRYDARQIISEKLQEVREQLPEGADNPTIAPQSSLLGEIMIFALTADSTDPMRLRTLADWEIRPRLLSVGGIAQVTIIGGESKQYQVLADPLRMRHYGVSLAEIKGALGEANHNSSGGFINEYGNKYLIRGMARTNNPAEIENNVIKIIGNSPVKISDVADVQIGAAPLIGTGAYRGRDAVVVTVSRQPDINTIKVTERINAELESIMKKLPPDVKLHNDVFNQAEFINTSIYNLNTALLEGAVLVIFILFIFLANLRTTVISVVAIPLSLMVATVALKMLGLTINTMSLGGFAIAIGSIVDDAIIDVENVYKRLKQNRRLPREERLGAARIVFEASREIRASILNATLIIIVAFVPLFFLTGMEGRMLQPLGISYIIALVASLVVAITITPVMCSYLLTHEKFLEKHEKESFVSRHLSKYYESALKKVMQWRKLTIAAVIALFIISVIIFFNFGRTFLPPFNEGSLTVNIAAMPGIALDESSEIGRRAEQLLLSVPEIRTTSRKTGRAELAEHSFGENVSEIDAPFELDDRSRAEFLEEVRTKLATLPGVVFSVGQPIAHRLDHLISGSKTSIAIKLFGTNLDKMYRIAQQIQTEIQGVEGVADLSVQQQINIPQLRIEPRREMLARYGISLAQFNEFVEAAIGGIKIDNVFEKERSFDMILRYEEQYRDRIESLRHILIDAADGHKVPLSLVADIRSSSGPNKVQRENVHRLLVISANTSGADLRGVVTNIQEIIDERIDLPTGYRIEYGGQFESEAKASRILFFTSIGAIFAIFLLLYQEFRNLLLAGIILVNLPLALIGGVFAILITGEVVSIPAIIGFITLFGIATRNGILLVSNYRRLGMLEENMREIVIKGSLDRLNPILMTALTAALALIPLAIAGDMPGNEIQSPMAKVILGGLLSSTFLNLLIIPIIYFMISKKSDLKFKQKLLQ